MYFYLPAYFANMTPPVIAKLGLVKFLDKPMDFGASYKGIRILGDNKTWRGLVSGTIVGMVVFLVQAELFSIPYFQRISLLDYNSGEKKLLVGFFLAFGALFGDALFSFFKRRIGLASGRKWIPFDQIDHVIGAFLLTSLVLPLDLKVWLLVLILTFFLHLFVNRIGFGLGISESKF